MKLGFYPKLAWDGIRKNKRHYLPYLLTCIGMVMMFYIVIFLQYNDLLMSLPGGGALFEILNLGGYVVALFSFLFLFYTHSFLIRSRKKEFGLYHVLGMSKRNIGRILFWEAVILAVGSLAAGLVGGITLSKLAELVLVNLLHADVRYTFVISSAAISGTVALFGVIFALLFLHALWQIRSTGVTELLRGANMGEKPPKGNRLIGLLGVMMLVAAYALAVSIQNPLSALVYFFLAVLLVIAGTYLLFISGSVVLCRWLQKRKRYYYRANHFVSVSSMAFRMKRNGAGLASICILSTMVLVMISSTTSLYFGSEDALRSRCPREINVELQRQNGEVWQEEELGQMRAHVQAACASYQTASKNAMEYQGAEIAGVLQNGVFNPDVTQLADFHIDTYDQVCELFLLPLADYNRLTGGSQTLQPGEILLYTDDHLYTGQTLTLPGGTIWNIAACLNDFPVESEAMTTIVPMLYLVVPDFDTSLSELRTLADSQGNHLLSERWYCAFDTDLEPDVQIQLNQALRDVLRSASMQIAFSYSCRSLAAERGSYYGLYGGLFFLGILLSLVFLFAAVMIIYYKQLSEGFDDQPRFAIMRKVGMSDREIRSSINSQLLTVFFLPLVFAGCHLAFAFPVIQKLLLLFQLKNIPLFVFTTVVSFLVFALLYTWIYRATSNTYYRLVRQNGS